MTTRWKLPSGETVDLDVDREELEQTLATAPRFSGLEAASAAQEEEILAAFASAEADPDPESGAVHLAALELLGRSDYSEEEYLEAVERVTTNPPPELGKTRTRPDGTPPARKVAVDPEGRPTRGGQTWEDADTYARHRRALEIDPGALADADRYATALEQARAEEEAGR